MTTKHETLTQIAREQLGIETLEQRNRDCLDFHDVGVISVQRAMDAAYHAGQAEFRGLLAAAEALLVAKDNQMETVNEWRRFRQAIRHARKQNTPPNAVNTHSKD